MMQDDTRVIDVNEMIARRMEELAMQANMASNDGFVCGLSAETIEIVEGAGEDGEDAENSNIIKTKEEAEKEANDILKEAEEEAQRIIEEARAQAAREKADVFDDARSRGLKEGREMANRELAAQQEELRRKQSELEAEYQSIVDELEPQFVDTITGIYEHIFHVELRSYREILTYLISMTMRKVEGNRDFMIHVSKEDYPYVSMQKKQIAAGATAAHSSVEVVEDMTLSKNECLIETEGGIFDCGLGTQLTELRQKLKILSYEK